MPNCPLCGIADFSVGFAYGKVQVDLCNQCGLGINHFQRPKESQERYYREDYYDGTHKLRFDENRFRMYQRDFRILTAGMAAGRVFDFGCGLGHFLHFTKQRGWEGRGMDISPRAVELARTLGVDAVAGTLEEAGAEAGQYDLATMWDVLDAIPNPVHALRVLHALLRPGGRLGIRGYNFQSRKRFFNLGQRLHSDFIRKNFSLFGEFAFSPAAISRVLSRIGFVRVRVHNSAVASDIYGPPYLKPLMFMAGISFSLASLLSGGRLLLSPGMLVIAEKGT
jgi:SAM-dependent methyltransferase